MSKRLASNERAVSLVTTLSAQGYSDTAISDKIFEALEIRWSRNAILALRKKLRINKNSVNKIQTTETQLNPDNSLSRPPLDIKPEQKPEWFREQFKKTHLYLTLHTQFNKDEIQVYLQEYGIICCQFEDLVVSEFFQIDDFLKHRILINRQLTLMKQTQEKISKMNLWLLEHSHTEGETTETTRGRAILISSLNAENAFLMRCNDRYDSLIDERDKIHRALAATRKDRVAELKHSASNFFDIVMQIQQNDKINEFHGKYAQYSKIAADEESDDLREVIEFPDGSKDFVLLDSDTVSGEKEGRDNQKYQEGQ